MKLQFQYQQHKGIPFKISLRTMHCCLLIVLFLVANQVVYSQNRCCPGDLGYPNCNNIMLGAQCGDHGQGGCEKTTTQPGGDSCSTATVITAADSPITALGPDSVGGTLASICFPPDLTSTAEWYSYTPEQDVEVTIASCGGGTDTRLSVYEGSCGALVCKASGDDDCDIGNGSLWASSVTFCAQSDTTYFIVWDNRWSGAGFVWTITETPLSCTNNDDCDDAIVLTVNAGFCNGTNTNGNNEGASEGDTASCFAGGANDAWFSFVAPPGGMVDISTDFLGGTLTDTEVAVWDACGGTEIACDQDGGTVVDFNSFIDDVIVTPGETYYVNVSGWNGQEGSFCIEVSTNQCFADRIQMADIMLDPDPDGSGYVPGVSTLWSPNIDFGFGPGLEGKVPAGAIIEPYNPGPGPNPDPGIVAPFDAFFFWIDHCPDCRFEHPTSFVLVDPTDCTPSVEEGSILVSDQDWWPVITLNDTFTVEVFNHDLFSAFPPGPFNPDGLIDGDVLHPDSVIFPVLPPPNASTSNSAAIVVAGDSRSDIIGDVPRWIKQLQDSYHLDSTRILRTVAGTAVDTPATKQQFCDLLDSLSTLMPVPDTIFIRVSSHGGQGSLCFSDGALTANQLCTKFKKVAKLGVPIMLMIDACHSASLFDVNNWGFPAGSMIITAAASGSLALGSANLSKADAMGNAIAGTKFTGAVFSGAHINCKNDTTDTDGNGKVDADTNLDGNVDDCEAFNWVQTKKPCFVSPLGTSIDIGSFTITHSRLYPSGPPDDYFPDTILFVGSSTFEVDGNAIVLANPMPAYRVVGNFSKSMNFNVQNNTGTNQNVFYMVFSGNVTGGSGLAWNSTAADVLTGTWASSATSTYNALKDETTVCWMASAAPATNQAYVHFGYSGDSKRLRPKRQYWGNTGSGANSFATRSVLDLTSVPSTESSIYLDGSGSPLTVSTINLNEFSGGTGHPVNYAIGYRISPVEVPLENLSLSDPMVSTLPLNPAGSGILDTNDLFQFEIEVPSEIKVGESLILQVDLDWTLNGNTIMQLIQWPALNPSICEDSIVFASGDTIPHQINSSGTITLHDVIFEEGITTLNAAGGVFATPGSQFNLPANATVIVYDYGCEEEIPPQSFGQQLFIGPDDEVILRDYHPKRN